MPLRRLLALRMDYDSRALGPLFDGRAQRYFREFAEELEEEAAEWALGHIKDTFHTHFKHPTGSYESHVRVRKEFGHAVVTDGGWAGPVYGPWLEGVGSRNASSRFKGYRAFRKAAEALDRRIDEIGERLFNNRYRHRF